FHASHMGEWEDTKGEEYSHEVVDNGLMFEGPFG
ncbi:hypothetical protein Q604_UNBc4C00334G0001, partial [human gut metagenome]